MRQVVRRPRTLRGSFVLPGDKSISHRSLILNAIANGSATITGLSSGQDLVSTARCLKALGVRMESADDHAAIVNGSGGRLQEPAAVLDADNSGTSMRLLAGLLATQPFLSVLTGDDSLRSRPMGRVVHPLKLMGANISGRQDNTLAPLVIRGGALRGIEYTMPVASAQVKSAIILAGLFAEKETSIHQPSRTRDHTERMVKAMGGHVEEEGLTLRIQPGQLRTMDIQVPGDISAAAFWIVAALCHQDAELRLNDVGINPSRTGVLEVLGSMGTKITQENSRIRVGEPLADLVVRSNDLRGTEIGGDLIPGVIDEIPILAVAASFAKGTTVIKDARELRVKESDRIATTVGELSRLGADIEERSDGMVIHGTGKLQGARCRSHGDHRLAMALGIAGLLAEGETIVDGAQAADISYPQFWQHVENIAESHAGDLD